MGSDGGRAAGPVDLLVVDDEECRFLGFRALLAPRFELRDCRRVGSLAEATELSARSRFHLALVSLSALRAGERGRAVRRSLAAVPIVLYGRAPGVSAEGLRSIGVQGFVSSRACGEQLVEQVTSALGVACQERSPAAGGPAAELSGGDLEVLGWLCRGLTNREIGQQMHLSHHTIKDRVEKLYRKLDARNRTHAVVRAERLGLVGSGEISPQMSGSVSVRLPHEGAVR